MSDAITDRISAILGGHTMWSSPGGGGLIECLCGLDMLVISEWATHVAEVIVEELPAWDVLMAILDHTYPASVFPTLSDDPDRDPGPRIVSLIRRINEIRELG